MRSLRLLRFCNGAVMRTALYSKISNGRLHLWSIESVCYMHIKGYEPGVAGSESCRARQSRIEKGTEPVESIRVAPAMDHVARGIKLDQRRRELPGVQIAVQHVLLR